MVRSSADSCLIDDAFFGKNFYSLHRDAIRKLTINDCLSDGTFKTIREFQSMNLPLSIATSIGLRSAVLLARKRIIQCDAQPITPDKFLKSIKKGSKKFREVIDRSVYQTRSVLDITVVNGFSKITKTPIQTEIIIKNFISGWNCTFLDNNFREFIFKCRNNFLRTGDRLSHIINNISDTCTFCNGITPEYSQRETFLHLFRECSVTSAMLFQLNVRCKLKWDSPDVDFNSIYWYGNCMGTLDRNI